MTQREGMPPSIEYILAIIGAVLLLVCLSLLLASMFDSFKSYLEKFLVWSGFGRWNFYSFQKWMVVGAIVGILLFMFYFIPPTQSIPFIP